MNKKINCKICNREFKSLVPSHLKFHGISKEVYQTQFPNSPVQSESDKLKRSISAKASLVPKWNKGLTKETDRRVYDIAKNAIGNKHTQESKEKISIASKKHWKDPQYRAKVIERSTIGIRNSYASGKRKHVINKDTIPETAVERCLIELNIKYIKQHPLYYSYPWTIKRVKFYDFYLPDYNKIIEVQGDYWHGKKYVDRKITWEELNNIQQQSILNDHLKFKIALDNSTEVFYIWEEHTKQKELIYEKINNILRTSYKLVRSSNETF
jgi:G:T-mismatch repair DNA endonuclease (very short patch repair protein)